MPRRDDPSLSIALLVGSMRALRSQGDYDALACAPAHETLNKTRTTNADPERIKDAQNDHA